MFLAFQILYRNRQSELIPSFLPASSVRRAAFKRPDRKNGISLTLVFFLSLRERALPPPPSQLKGFHHPELYTYHPSLSGLWWCVVAVRLFFSFSGRTPSPRVCKLFYGQEHKFSTPSRLALRFRWIPVGFLSRSPGTTPTSIFRKHSWAPWKTPFGALPAPWSYPRCLPPNMATQKNGID